MELYLFNRLKKIYPDMKITNLIKEHPYLYQYINRLAKEKELTITQTLSDMGFEYITKKRGVTSNFDSITAVKLLDEYDVSQTDLSEWLGVTRQAINSKIKRNVQGLSWVCNELESSEIYIINQMVEERIYTFKEDSLLIAIRNNGKKACLIIILGDSIKVVFEIPENTNDLLLNNNYHIFSPLDYDIKNNLQSIFFLGKKLAKAENQRIRTKISQRCEKLGISADDYCQLHGFEGIADGRMITDEEIIDVIDRKYVLKDNIVFFPHTEDDYFNFVNRASRAGMTIDEFFEFYGYIKVDSRLESSYKNKIEEYKFEIKKNVINDQNHVFIKTDSNLYRKLYPFAKRRNISLDDFLLELGYVRVYDKNEITTFDDYNSRREIKKTFEEPNKIERILFELQHIQGNMNRVFNNIEHIQRNKELVRKLKELYDYRCQLCDSELGIPLIEKLDGTYYVEVHHITAISSIKNAIENEELLDEIKNLDTYKNAVVVCPFHHKTLHYHQGGFNRLTLIENELFFVSKKETLLKIKTNYHLEPF
ncbi:HNH endonuclease [Heliorestis acidaminivorans]|uniref:HNH endonuclease n=1 Tax=Heliorestis acidaminivorans TaxID=553427 RepID=A0A6I0F4L0_9FIRM|nr:HNH endonuclease signature motif containing protein [Heliorestis acidaminivorans]KAB2952150.1 HNH endonuclease [Heliorestis acidaminivorans]